MVLAARLKDLEAEPHPDADEKSRLESGINELRLRDVGVRLIVNVVESKSGMSGIDNYLEITITNSSKLGWISPPSLCELRRGVPALVAILRAAGHRC